MEGAVRTVITTIQLGIPVARIELLDEAQLDAVNKYSKLNCVLKPTLFFEFHGTSQDAVSESATAVQDIAAEHGGRGIAGGEAAGIELETQFERLRHLHR